MSTAPPLVSVIVPLEYHRGQWERCLAGWHAQTIAKSQYEVVLVVPPDFPADARHKLAALLGPQDRLEHTNESHDIALCAVGAARSQGEILFFTEAHCWPEPDVLERCLRRLSTDTELAGFSCRSIRVSHNRLSEAEADMYEADIEYGMNIHPWLKILDQCFVTRRDCYDRCGGFRLEFGHFSEWILSANYHALGYKIGYEPEARFYHYYIGDLAEVRRFTNDFVAGEIRYFASRSQDRGRYVLEEPPEWTCQGNWDRRLARRVIALITRNMFQPATWGRRRIIKRWLGPAIWGGAAVRALAWLNVCRAWTKLRIASLAGSKASLDAAFKTYIAALIRHQRLARVALANRTRNSAPPGKPMDLTWDPFAPGNLGFYPIEKAQGTMFRWTEGTAMMCGWLPAGRHRICIECMPVRRLGDGSDLRFYFNERPVADSNVSIAASTVEIKVDVAVAGVSRLAWRCFPFPGVGDERELGLAVKHVRWEPEPARWDGDRSQSAAPLLVAEELRNPSQDFANGKPGAN